VLESYPQTLEAIVSYFGLPDGSQVTVLQEGCGNIVTGFALNGTTEVELDLPEGTCAMFDGRYAGKFDLERGYIVFAPAPDGVVAIARPRVGTPEPSKVMGGLIKIGAASLTYHWAGCSE
jgi:hypothetical protein